MLYESSGSCQDKLQTPNWIKGFDVSTSLNTALQEIEQTLIATTHTSDGDHHIHKTKLDCLLYRDFHDGMSRSEASSVEADYIEM